ncbi:MAG TPA: lantibiotic dehydratase [Pseudonocardiaceae bacterium]|nr:lantibiotic dehydratase [Pseudonocardiaceae bacterium]
MVDVGGLGVKAPERARWYRHVDAALLRASAHTGEVIPRSWPELDVDTEIEQWCAWLAQVWAQPSVAEAVAVASPVLADRVEAVCDGLRPAAGQLRRMVLSLARYLVRMRGRATPFGAFAGVAALRFGPGVSARWTDAHQVRTRADAVWLAAVIASLESCPALRRRLSVTVNDLVVVRGERLVVPWQPGAGDPGRGTSVEVSVRHSPPVQTITQAARSPIQIGDLIDKVATEFPATPVSAIDAMVAELVARGVLITSLRPPSTSTDGLAHVLHRLQEVDAAALREAAGLVGELRAIHAQLQATDRATSWVDGQARRATAARMRALSNAVEQPLMVDLGLGATMVLPPQVATEAESAAGALLRLTRYPTGNPAWREYHGRFVSRYGSGAVVPVEQLIDPTAGLGFPRHYSQQGRGVPAAEMSRRDEQLLRLAQQAALDGAREIVLDDDDIDALAGGGRDVVRPAPHVDLCVEIRAPTTTALAEGAFMLAVTGIGRTAIATTGRFLDVVPDADRHRMITQYGRLPAGVEGALPAQLSFPPNPPRVGNVVRAPLVLPAVISLAEHRDGGQGRIPVQDLAVIADHDRLYVVSLSQRRVVEPVLTHAAARHTMPALARLLCEIPRATSAAVSLLDWGAGACLPFRPRVRYARSILAPARWRVCASHLPGPAAPRRKWTAAMAVMRERLRLPANVSVGTADRRLRLNLDDPLDLALLRAHLDAADDAVTVAEAPTATDHGWFAGRAHEIVIPLAATAPPACAPAILTSSAPLPIIGREHGMLPGSQVLFAKLYSHPDVVDTILTRHLPALLAAWDDPPPWWFVRYRTPAPHLRLRIHHLQDYGQAAARVGAWAADLRRRGLVGDLTLDTYHPETARYGSAAAMAAAEALFAADSAAVVAQLTALASSPEVHAHALTAASLVDLVCAMTGSRPAAMRWLIDHPELADPASVGDRTVLRQSLSLAGLGRDEPAPLNIPSGWEIASAWDVRRQAATRYTDCLAAGATHVKPASVVVALLHLHHVRAHGIDPDAEALTHRLARAVALAFNARQNTTEDNPR